MGRLQSERDIPFESVRPVFEGAGRIKLAKDLLNDLFLVLENKLDWRRTNDSTHSVLAPEFDENVFIDHSIGRSFPREIREDDRDEFEVFVLEGLIDFDAGHGIWVWFPIKEEGAQKVFREKHDEIRDLTKIGAWVIKEVTDFVAVFFI